MKNRRNFLKKSALAVTGLTFVNSLSAKSYRKIIGSNESVYIPLGVKHRLSNPTKLPLTLIEIQSGSYLGEDDIVRFKDIYNR